MKKNVEGDEDSKNADELAVRIGSPIGVGVVSADSRYHLLCSESAMFYLFGTGRGHCGQYWNCE